MGRHGAFLGNRHIPIEMIGLYWHFIDIIWMFLLGLLWLGILIVGTTDDLLTRGWLPNPGK